MCVDCDEVSKSVCSGEGCTTRRDSMNEFKHRKDCPVYGRFPKDDTPCKCKAEDGLLEEIDRLTKDNEALKAEVKGLRVIETAAQDVVNMWLRFARKSGNDIETCMNRKESFLYDSLNHKEV